MICNLILCKFIFRNKKLKMSDQTTCIPFEDIAEIEFVVRRKDWYKCDAIEFNADKTIPFIKLLIGLVGADTKYHLNQTRLERYEN